MGAQEPGQKAAMKQTAASRSAGHQGPPSRERPAARAPAGAGRRKRRRRRGGLLTGFGQTRRHPRLRDRSGAASWRPRFPPPSALASPL